MITLKQIKKCNTVEDLNALGLGTVSYDLSERGGYVGFRSSVVAEAFDIPEHELTPKIGAYSNYLGGGVRGSIKTSESSKVSVPVKRARVDALAQACMRSYMSLEDEVGMNDDFEDDINWNARATQAARHHGVTSAY
jgi:hypothetical protein